MDAIDLRSDLRDYLVVPEHITHLAKQGEFGTRIYFVSGEHIDVPGGVDEVYRKLNRV